MGKQKHLFGEGPIFTITNYLFWFLISNFYFFLMNIPMLFILFLIMLNDKSQLGITFYVTAFICFLPVGPAAAALLSVMGKLLRNKDLSVTKDFFDAYKTNFKQAFLLWALELTIITILLTDSLLFKGQNSLSIISSFLLLLVLIILMAGLFVLPIISRFSLKSLDILKLSLHYTFKRFNIAFLNLATISIIIFAVFKLSGFIILICSSLSCFLIMYYEQQILAEIETSLKQLN